MGIEMQKSGDPNVVAPADVTPKLLIVCGHPRSGTTMLCRVLNSHPDISMSFEFHNFRRLNTQASDHLRPLRTTWLKRRLIKRNRSDGRLARTLASGWFLHRYRRGIRRLDADKIGVESVRGVLRSIFPRALVVGDKTPAYVFGLDRLARFDGLKRLVIYRDCRDVANSAMKMAQTKWDKTKLGNRYDTPEKVAHQWVKAIELMEMYADRVVSLRYEDLVTNPGQITTALGEWLGVDPAAFRVQQIRTSSVHRHRSELSRDEIARIVEIAGPTMERLGYLD